VTGVSTRIIAVAGGPASGKTTAVAGVAAALGASVVNVDDYWAGHDPLTLPGRWEDPGGYDLDTLAGDLAQLRAGQAVPARALSRESKAAGRSGGLVQPATTIFCEGFLALHHPGVVAEADLAVWVEVPERELCRRRLERASRVGLHGGPDAPSWVRGAMLVAYRSAAAIQRPRADIVLDGTLGRAALAAALAAAVAGRARAGVR